MRKLLLFLLFALSYSLLVISPSPLFALGQPCCPPYSEYANYTYNEGTNECEIILSSQLGTTQSVSTQCAAGEYCDPTTVTCISAQEASDISLPGAPAVCDEGTGTPTALGCIPNNPKQAIPLILNWAVGIGTGLGFLLLIYGAFTLITAGPNPENVDKGKSIITSAVSGLLFIILSVVLLKIIGISILGL